MTVVKLGEILRDMYDNAPHKEQTTMIHLFGVKYADEIRGNGFIPKDILKVAQMPISYQIEINKGIKLAKYVSIKTDILKV